MRRTKRPLFRLRCLDDQRETLLSRRKKVYCPACYKGFLSDVAYKGHWVKMHKGTHV